MAIAEAVVAGKPIAQVARDLGVSRCWVSRETHAPGTGALIDELMVQHADRIKALLAASLDALEGLLEARKFVYRAGTAIDVGPDHCIQLKAAGLLIKLSKLIGTNQTSHTISARFLRVLISIAELAAQVAARVQRQVDASL
jgi:hypothetical protein